MADTGDVDTLKRRGRRRLVGAIALVLAAVIVLPMVFDQQPRQTPTSVNIRIPREDSGTFTPKVAPTPVPSGPAASKDKDGSGTPPAGGAAEAAAAKSASAPKSPTEPGAPKPAAAQERERAEAALANIEYVVPVVALSSADRVRAVTGKLKAEKIPYYTEPVSTASGRVTRVRAGPFASREEADRARARLERLGLKPGAVAQRSE